jgi:aspartate aminotransferase
MAASIFHEVKTADPIEELAILDQCDSDPDDSKVNLSPDAYRTDEGKPWVLPVVRRVEMSMASDQSLNKEYLPVAGLPDLTKGAARLLLGGESVAFHEQRVVAFQGLGGTGALRVGADLLHQQCGKKIVYVTDPTWGNHIGIFKMAGYEVRKYNYWNEKAYSLDFDSVLAALNGAPEGAVFVLHAICHNPTGVDLSQDQWRQVAGIMKERKLFPFFDIAYQGFASGDLDSDAWAVRHFVNEGFECLVAQSFSKNFGLYNERVGNLVVVVSDSAACAPIKSQTELIIRKSYSNPPSHGARVVASVLNNPALQTEWREHVKNMAARILAMRQGLYTKLKSRGTPGSWEHIIQQNGMFSYTGLNAKQCEFLIKEYHIYLLKSGRINICGLTPKNLDYVANAIHEAVTQVKDEPKL